MANALRANSSSALNCAHALLTVEEKAWERAI